MWWWIPSQSPNKNHDSIRPIGLPSATLPKLSESPFGWWDENSRRGRPTRRTHLKFSIARWDPAKCLLHMWTINKIWYAILPLYANSTNSLSKMFAFLAAGPVLERGEREIRYQYDFTAIPKSALLVTWENMQPIKKGVILPLEVSNQMKRGYDANSICHAFFL